MQSPYGDGNDTMNRPFACELGARRFVRSGSRFRRLLLLLTMIFATTGCAMLDQAGRNPTEPLNALVLFLFFSLIWLVPAGFLYLMIGSDREELKTVHGTAWGPQNGTVNIDLRVPTGRTIRGNPKLASAVAVYWTTLIPAIAVGVILIVPVADAVFGERKPNLLIFVPLLVLVGFAVWATGKARKAEQGGWCLVGKVWKVIIVAASIHLAGWLAYLPFH